MNDYSSCTVTCSAAASTLSSPGVAPLGINHDPDQDEAVLLLKDGWMMNGIPFYWSTVTPFIVSKWFFEMDPLHHSLITGPLSLMVSDIPLAFLKNSLESKNEKKKKKQAAELQVGKVWDELAEW